MSKALIAGVGMVPFAKPGRSDPYNVMGTRAAKLALEDARLEYAAVEQAYVGYVYGDSTCGQAALYPLGLTGIPVINVNNNCSTGSSALYLARQAVESGAVECALALGFEQMVPGALQRQYTDRPMPLEAFFEAAKKDGFEEQKGLAPQLFGAAARDYRRRFGLDEKLLARITVKSRRHAAKNPLALFKDQVTEEEVLASPMMAEPLTRLQCCPPTCGAAAALVVSESFAKKRGLDARVRIAAQAMTTDRAGSFHESDMRKTVGFEMSQEAARKVFDAAGVGPEDVDVIELHDCFTINELISYEALGLAPEGEGEKLIADGDNTFGGKWVTNPSGGLISKGHPLGATGLAQCYELVSQLRGSAGDRQVEGARVALQHNIGLGGACVVTLYELAI
ncbi:MAG: lipid-transfer protein [Betaproteobacteria bacterium RIFCSPHIGHO2_12_FULL_69_13]|nr:MAG: lipid-transfer protein [Betaproteobacteria bacterium RIFCSPHIGHO2_12_FULL_69_13]OGA68641.1 MAG: lipid-transfer protein [Betaproteobacteria bacterium RIFCSPLOWO2_12_FULL_68_20]